MECKLVITSLPQADTLLSLLYHMPHFYAIIHMYMNFFFLFLNLWSQNCRLSHYLATSPAPPLQNGSLPPSSSDWPVSGYSSSFSLSSSDVDSSGTHPQYLSSMCGPAEPLPILRELWYAVSGSLLILYHNQPHPDPFSWPFFPQV